MKVGMVQQSNTADIASNIEKLQKNIRLAVSQGAELVVLQELHNGLYFCQTELYSLSLNGVLRGYIITRQWCWRKMAR